MALPEIVTNKSRAFFAEDCQQEGQNIRLRAKKSLVCVKRSLQKIIIKVSRLCADQRIGAIKEGDNYCDAAGLFLSVSLDVIISPLTSV